MAAGWIKSAPKYLSAAAMLAALALPSSCAENGVSIFVRGVVATTPPDCAVKADSDTILLPGLYFDAALRDTLILNLAVGSQLLGRGDPKTSRSEPNRVQIYSAEIKLTDQSGGDLFGGSTYTVPVIGTVDPTASADATYAPISFEAVPSSIGPKLAVAARSTTYTDPGRSFLVSVRLFGRTLGGTEVESRPVNIPVRGCYGCTPIFSTDAVDSSALGSVNCEKASTGGGTGEGQTCYKGQELTDCRLCHGVLKDGVFPCRPCLNDTNCSPGSKCNVAVGRCAL